MRRIDMRIDMRKPKISQYRNPQYIPKGENIDLTTKSCKSRINKAVPEKMFRLLSKNYNEMRCLFD